ncbi:MAG TPA: GNAT family protein [Burkholderiaceae bacterium]
MHQSPLRTPRLQLRLLAPEDADALFALMSEPEVMRYFSEPPWGDHARAVEQIEKDTQAFLDGAYYRFAIEVQATGAMIGTCTLFAIHQQNRRAEVGYALHPAHWGQGYMAEAMDALLAHAFGTLDLRRLEADIDPRNTASAALLHKLGFQKEGHLRERWIVGGETSDSDLYGLLRREWRAVSV